MEDQEMAGLDGLADGGLRLAAGDEALRRSQQRLNLLAEAGRLLASATDYEATLEDVCRLVVPTLADWCLLDVTAADGSLRRLGVAHRDPGLVELAREVQRRYPPAPESHRGLYRVLQTGEPEVGFEITDEHLAAVAHDDEHLGMLRRLGFRSAMVIPLTARGRTLGVLTLMLAESGRRYREDDLPVAMELGGRIALAVDNARLFAEAREAIRLREEALERHCRIEERLRLLVEASGGLSASLAMGDVAGAVLALSRRLIAADGYAVWRYQEASGRWGIVMASGLSDEYQRATVEVLPHTPRVPDAPIVAEDIGDHPLLGRRRERLEREGIRSMLVLPLGVRGARNGTLVFYYRSPHRFDEADVSVATALANLAGAAIGSAELYDEVCGNDRRKDEFLAMLAHELRNPLSAISNATLLIRAYGSMSEPVAWSMEIIDRQLKNLVRLIDDLLDVSRITRGKIRLDRARLDVRPILDGAVAAVLRMVDDRGHRLECACEPGLEVEADATRLEQIVVNLLTNAVRYTERGGLIRLEARRDPGPGEVVIEVRDTGVGIAADQIPRMFELFVQGDRSLERAEGGLGVGLTIVRKLAEMHGGGVQAHSEGPGRGSAFVVRLPAAGRDCSGP